MDFIRQHGSIIGFALFVLVAGWLFVQPEPALKGKIDLSPIKKSFQDYSSSEVDLSDVPIDEQLAPQEILMRDYQRGDEPPVTLCLVYNYMRRSHSFHDPHVCYPAQGYTLSNERKLPMQIAGQTVPANVIVADRNAQKYLVLYWYLSKDKPVEFSGSRQGDIKALIMSRLKRTLGVSSMVRVSAPMMGTQEQTMAQLTSYLQTFYPMILEVRPPLGQEPMPATKLWDGGVGGRALMVSVLVLPLAFAIFALPRRTRPLPV